MRRPEEGRASIVSTAGFCPRPAIIDTYETSPNQEAVQLPQSNRGFIIQVGSSSSAVVDTVSTPKAANNVKTASCFPHFLVLKRVLTIGK